MSMNIDCGTCTRRNTSTCDSGNNPGGGSDRDECVVNFILGREPNEAVIVDVAEYAALKRLHSAGMISDLNRLAI